ncbi:MAG: hypothetical protein ABI693_33025 [Bryobacteraceae bacterium]
MLACCSEEARAYRRSHDQAAAAEVLVSEACMFVREEGCKDLIVQADISKEDQVKEMFAKVIDSFGSIDIRGSFLCSREPIRHFLSRGPTRTRHRRRPERARGRARTPPFAPASAISRRTGPGQRHTVRKPRRLRS